MLLVLLALSGKWNYCTRSLSNLSPGCGEILVRVCPWISANCGQGHVLHQWLPLKWLNAEWTQITAVTLDDAVFGINRLERKSKLRRLTAPFALNIKTWKEPEGLEGIYKKKSGGGWRWRKISRLSCYLPGILSYWWLLQVEALHSLWRRNKRTGGRVAGGIKGNGIQSEGSQGVPLLPPDLPSYHASSSSLLFHPFLSFLSPLSICWSRTPDEGANWGNF